tara:strand:- start:320 stop:649 length:330 start_codon:yes stop_codon:yes gene_type:complete
MKAKPIIISGKDYPVKYGYAALRHFSDATGTTLGDLGTMGESMTITQAIALVWAGLKDGARVTKTEFDLDLDDVADLLDEDDKAMERVLSVFSESLAPKSKKKALKKVK